MYKVCYKRSTNSKLVNEQWMILIYSQICKSITGKMSSFNLSTNTDIRILLLLTNLDRYCRRILS